MPNTEDTEKVERELQAMLHSLSLTELRAFFTLLCQSNDKEWLARKATADYVLDLVRERLHKDVAGLGRWVRDAKVFYSKGLKNEHRRASFRTESGRAEELIARDPEHGISSGSS